MEKTPKPTVIANVRHPSTNSVGQPEFRLGGQPRFVVAQPLGRWLRRLSGRTTRRGGWRVSFWGMVTKAGPNTHFQLTSWPSGESRDCGLGPRGPVARDR